MRQLNDDTMRLRHVMAASTPALAPDGDRAPLLGMALALPSGREAAALFAGLADVLPVPVIATDCGPQLRIAYANAAAHRSPALSGTAEGRPFADAFPTSGENPFLPVLWRACETGEPAHLRDFPCAGLADAHPCLPGGVTMWDWDVFPVLARRRGESRLLVTLRDVTGRHLRAASLRAAGQAPTGRPQEDLTAREMEVATLIAHGLRNPIIARRLHISRTTVASHVTRILQKLGFRTRAQIAAWVVQQQMRDVVAAP